MRGCSSVTLPPAFPIILLHSEERLAAARVCLSTVCGWTLLIRDFYISADVAPSSANDTKCLIGSFQDCNICGVWNVPVEFRIRIILNMLCLSVVIWAAVILLGVLNPPCLYLCTSSRWLHITLRERVTRAQWSSSSRTQTDPAVHAGLWSEEESSPTVSGWPGVSWGGYPFPLIKTFQDFTYTTARQVRFTFSVSSVWHGWHEMDDIPK